MGIGADDVFIFTDLWLQSKTVHTHLDERLLWTYKHATMAMLITSVTTASSFFANLASAIIPIREFGVFMGLIVLCNYLAS